MARSKSQDTDVRQQSDTQELVPPTVVPDTQDPPPPSQQGPTELPSVVQEPPVAPVIEKTEAAQEPVAPEPTSEEPTPVAASAPVRTGLTCPVCGSTAVGIAGGLRRCNQCSHSWAPLPPHKPW